MTNIEFPPSKKIGPEEQKDVEWIIKFFQEDLRPAGEIFIGDYSPFRIKLDLKADTFYFDHRNRVIGISQKLIGEKKLDNPEKIFGFLHELGHLIQLYQDSEKYLRGFEIPREKTENVPQEFKAFVEQCWHRFFNIFLDIHVNSMIKGRMPFFQTNEGGKRITGLYRKLFPQDDLTITEIVMKDPMSKAETIIKVQTPYSIQFLYATIIKVMDPTRDLNVDEIVKEKLNQSINYLGINYLNIYDFVSKRIGDPDTDVSNVMFRLEQTLIAIFEELIQEDIKRGSITIPVLEIDLDGDLDEGSIKDIAKGIKETEKSTTEKAEDIRDRMLEDMGIKAGLTEEQIKRMKEIIRATESYVEDMTDLWRRFVQITTELVSEKIEPLRRGAGISPEALIRELPVLLTKPQEAEIFYSHILKEAKETIKPKKIFLFLILDLSESMDEPKRKAVQEVAHILGGSLIKFYRDVKITSQNYGYEESPINIDLRVIGFGSNVQEIMSRIEQEKREKRKIDEPVGKLDKDLMEAIFNVSINLYGTEDDEALQIALEEAESRKDLLESDDEIMIVLEITDGETQTAESSKQIIQKLNSIANVYCRAIQIPGPVYSEVSKKDEQGRPLPPEILQPTGTFKEVWGDLGRRLEQLPALKETILSILKNAIEKATAQ